MPSLRHLAQYAIALAFLKDSSVLSMDEIYGSSSGLLRKELSGPSPQYCLGSLPILEVLTSLHNSHSHEEAVLERDAFHIFNSVHHLLRQWGNNFMPNGFSYTKGWIPVGTTLYHARLVSFV